jgi:hypothetical protein
MPEPTSRYTLPGPCSNCPFRNDQPSYLRPERVIEIGTALLNQEDFMCHKTVEYVEDDEGMTEGITAPKTRACGGAMATLAREGKGTQMQRITERVGGKVAEFAPDIPVYDSIAEWVHAKNGVPTVAITAFGVTEIREYEHCGVVSAECEDPAGYMMGGGASESLHEPTCNPETDECSACGSLMCEACRSEGDPDMCVNCAEEDDEDE